RASRLLAAIGLALAVVAPSGAAPPSDGGAVSGEGAKAVAEKRKTESESPAAGAGAQKLGKGPHGALPVADQLVALEKLGLHDDPVQPASRVDPLVWQSLVPKDNEVNAARVALGKKLYFDTRLSKDGTLACATCHDVSRSFTDRRPVSEGIADQLGQ